MDARKEAICNALAAFIRQRPGLDPRNYISHVADDAGRRAYFSEQRRIARDKRDAETLLLAVRHNDGITADMILEASRSAYSGRLAIVVDAGPGMTLTAHADNVRGRPVRIDYCTGQYWPTEYRRAAAAVCAAALWDWQRENMPVAWMLRDGHKVYPPPGTTLALPSQHIPAGDWLRRKFRETFGSALQKRYFD